MADAIETLPFAELGSDVRRIWRWATAPALS